MINHHKLKKYLNEVKIFSLKSADILLKKLVLANGESLTFGEDIINWEIYFVILDKWEFKI